jgi:hypothetical protein
VVGVLVGTVLFAAICGLAILVLWWLALSHPRLLGLDSAEDREVSYDEWPDGKPKLWDRQGKPGR